MFKIRPKRYPRSATKLERLASNVGFLESWLSRLEFESPLSRKSEKCRFCEHGSPCLFGYSGAFYYSCAQDAPRIWDEYTRIIHSGPIRPRST